MSYIVKKVTFSEFIIYNFQFSFVWHCCAVGIYVLSFMFSIMISGLNDLVLCFSKLDKYLLVFSSDIFMKFSLQCEVLFIPYIDQYCANNNF